ncbi:hypothetical protein ACLOJK_027438 [Asimina triloba]
MEYIPCSQSQSVHRLLRCLQMRDMKSQLTPYLRVPEQIFTRQDETTKPRSFMVETTRQIKFANPNYEFESGSHDNYFRGSLIDIVGFNESAQYVVSHHGEVLEKADLRDKDVDVINTFINFWLPAMNSFIFPFGEMGITL